MILVDKGADMNRSADQKDNVEESMDDLSVEPEGTLEDGASGNVYIY
jgi:hypothetical protein